jgi:methylglyoxal synthase
MQQTIALIAHDGKKADMVAFATYNREQLRNYRLIATASTGKLLISKVGLEVTCLASGPYEGDAQIGAQVVEGGVEAVIFLVNPLDKHSHNPDIQIVAFSDTPVAKACRLLGSAARPTAEPPRRRYPRPSARC